MIYTETIVLKATVVFDSDKGATGDYEDPAMQSLINGVLPIDGVELVRAEVILRATSKTPEALLPDRPTGSEPD